MLDAQNMTNSRVFGLDFLRFLAVALVVFGHGVQLLPSFPEATQYSRMIDYLGVELFFVLSGYLIGGIFIKSFSERPNWKELTTFWKRRWWRTLPNYYLFLLINILGFWLLTDNFTFDWRYLLFLQNAFSPDQQFFSVSWSLTIEEFFYLTVPLLFLIFLKLPCGFSTSFWLLVISVLVGSLLLRFQYIAAGDVTWNDDMRRIMILRMDSLIYGVIMAWMFFWHPNIIRRWRLYLIIPGLIMIGVSVWFRHHPSINTSPWMLLFIFPAASIGIAFLLPFLSTWLVDKRKKRALFIQLITSVSLWSYSLYLIHVPAIEVFRIVFDDAVSGSKVLQVTLFALWLTLSIIGSAILYKYFEKPMTAMRDRDFTFWSRSPRNANEMGLNEAFSKRSDSA